MFSPGASLTFMEGKDCRSIHLKTEEALAPDGRPGNTKIGADCTNSVFGK